MGLAGPSSSNSNFGQNHPNSFKIKQEPTLSVQRKNNIQNRTNRAQNPRGKPNNRPNNTQQRDNKPCYFCGKEVSPNHKLSCPAKNVICNNCNKKGHFARCCNSRSDVGIVDDDSEITAEEECEFIASVSEPEYSLLNISPSVGKTNQGHKPERAVKKLEFVKSATGKRDVSNQTESQQNIFKATIDTGSPASFINKKTADILLKSGANIK